MLLAAAALSLHDHDRDRLPPVFAGKVVAIMKAGPGLRGWLTALAPADCHAQAQ
jgi:hypothetical protein